LGGVIRLTSYAGRVKRRPSFATAVALLALFVALGGPAEAQRLLSKGSVTSFSVKDRSLKLRDLSRKTVRRLQTTRNNSITEAKLANRSVTAGKLAPGAVGTAAIADGSILGADLANGSLTAAQLGRFWGRFKIEVPGVAAGACWSGEPAGLTPELAGADISQDVALVTPDSRWPEDRLSFTVRNSANPMRFVLAGCNRTGAPVPAFEVGFRYLIIDLP
jgi:hypothetical protein